ncbi:MAG: YqgE/AlgH family protein [Cyclobacteriaceae bacterium]
MDYFVHDDIVLPERGDLLISEPYLPDPNFERTVIYLCEHDENGSFGFVLNREAPDSLDNLIGVNGFDTPVYVGGPVQQDTLHFLHSDDLHLETNKEISEGVHWGVDFDGLIDAIENKTLDPGKVRFFVGYSGWSDGQLMDEIKAKSWIVFKQAGKHLVFDTDPASLWQTVLKEMGGKFRAISNYPTDPRLN